MQIPFTKGYKEEVTVQYNKKQQTNWRFYILSRLLLGATSKKIPRPVNFK
jgi:hypothetical protein